ncbi:MAG: transposase [Syntrophales bacterium]|nr:transposase [Syntrophales bacterium]
MPRIARAVALDYPHHVTQRGNAKQNIFFEECDYIYYRKLIAKFAPKYDLDIWAYCFMPNHVHFVVVPRAPNALSRTFNTCHMLYAQYYNQKLKTSGHVWQGRFFSCILDEKHLYAAIRYIELNPVRAGLVSEPQEYRWSSARGHFGMEVDPLLRNPSPIKQSIEDWRLFLTLPEDEEAVRKIKKYTHSGLPCGDDNFIRSLAGRLSKPIKIRSRGRPPKSKPDNTISSEGSEK